MYARRRAIPVRLAVVSITIVVTSLSLAVPAMAAPQVTIPATFPANNQTITVTGSGFPARDEDPTGIAILECADPSGTQADLPTSAARCDGSTLNPLQINTDASGNFSASFTFRMLNGVHTSNIWCDSTHFCVLWVGVDYNNSFLGVHAFSTPFKVGARGSAPGGSGVPAVALWLPITLIVVLGAGFIVGRQRGRRGSGGQPKEEGRSALSVG